VNLNFEIKLSMRKKKKNLSQYLAIGFLMLSILLVCFISYIAFSHATIILIPEKSEKSATVKITIDSGKNEIDLQNSIIPGILVAENFKKTYSNIPIGNKAISAKSSGKVVIYNKRDVRQYLLIESQLQGEKNKEMIFLTNKAVIIPAFGSVEMEITAKDAGAKGNIPAQRFNFIKLSPSMQKLVYAVSSDFMKGGFSEGTILTQEDIDAAKEKYAQDFSASLKAEAMKRLEGTSKTIREELSEEKITEVSANIPVGTSSPSFNLTIQGQITAIAFNENHIISIAVSALKYQADKEDFIKYAQNSLEYSNVSTDWTSAKASVEAKISGLFLSQISPSLFQKKALIGMEKEEAIKYLESFPEIQFAEIHFWPPWNDTIPGGLKSNIRIDIENSL